MLSCRNRKSEILNIQLFVVLDDPFKVLTARGASLQAMAQYIQVIITKCKHFFLHYIKLFDSILHHFITSHSYLLGKGGYVFNRAGLSVCL